MQKFEWCGRSPIEPFNPGVDVVPADIEVMNLRPLGPPVPHNEDEHRTIGPSGREQAHLVVEPRLRTDSPLPWFQWKIPLEFPEVCTCFHPALYEISENPQDSLIFLI